MSSSFFVFKNSDYTNRRLVLTPLPTKLHQYNLSLESLPEHSLHAWFVFVFSFFLKTECISIIPKPIKNVRLDICLTLVIVDSLILYENIVYKVGAGTKIFLPHTRS